MPFFKSPNTCLLRITPLMYRLPRFRPAAESRWLLLLFFFFAVILLWLVIVLITLKWPNPSGIRKTKSLLLSAKGRQQSGRIFWYAEKCPSINVKLTDTVNSLIGWLTSREEQYRQLWAELEALVRSYSDTSEQHAKVLTCLQECRKPPQAGAGDDASAHASVPLNRKLSTPGQGAGVKDAGKSGGSEVEQSWRDLDR